MGRQKIHLSASPASSRGVGERHAADPTILRVDAAAMLSDGRRVTKRGRDTYTADRPPPEYLTVKER
jgi:putative RNA 2'-phosphotransferase